ncbi:MAG: hypothetical protein QX189_07995 [Methylococcales bacterium]
MRATTGLTLKQFDELLGDFDRAYEKALDADRSKRGCERKKGAGKKPRLASTRLKLFFVLIYLKCYPTRKNIVMGNPEKESFSKPH